MIHAGTADRERGAGIAPPTLFIGISALVQPHAEEGSNTCPLDVIEDAALLVRDGVVIAAGPRREEELRSPHAARVDLGGRAVVPGLVDSHTHIVFAGERIDEMARRARGETYEQIAEAGGGIANTVSALTHASEQDLALAASKRLAAMVRRGVTTCEVKSGYGLVPAQELKQLRAVQRLAGQTPATVVATALAHIIPPDRRSDRPGFVRAFCEEVLNPAAANGLARCFDVFVEQGAFTPAEARQLCRHARALGLAIKLHVDQLRDGDGARLAAELGALSADHLEYVSSAGAARLSEAGVVATVLPGCALFLGKGPWPPARMLRDAGCAVAVATDCNPGSSMISDLWLCAATAATRCGLSLEEALWGITRGGAKALGLDDRGTLRAGERADFVVVDHADWRAPLYRVGDAPIYGVYVQGRPITDGGATPPH